MPNALHALHEVSTPICLAAAVPPPGAWLAAGAVIAQLGLHELRITALPSLYGSQKHANEMLRLATEYHRLSPEERERRQQP